MGKRREITSLAILILSLAVPTLLAQGVELPSLDADDPLRWLDLSEYPAPPWSSGQSEDLVLDWTRQVRGQSDEGDGGSGLAQQSQNPIANLASVPFQNNFDFGMGPSDRTRFVGNLQPVVPWQLNEHWNLITRAIVPFIDLPIGTGDRMHGIGDSIGQFFFVPRTSGDLTWGVGPAVLFPTASDPTLGFQEWGVGVNAVGLITRSPIVSGALVHQIWSTQGNVKPFLIQPFFNYNFSKGWFLAASGEFNADWERPSGSRWTNVLGMGIGRTFPLAGQPITVITRFAPYLSRPAGGPNWQFRLQMALLFPK